MKTDFEYLMTAISIYTDTNGNEPLKPTKLRQIIVMAKNLKIDDERIETIRSSKHVPFEPDGNYPNNCKKGLIG